jgi:energy-coupling factor transporter transmembrane protein EcfT
MTEQQPSYPLIKSSFIRKILGYTSIVLFLAMMIAGFIGKPDGLFEIFLGPLLMVWAFAIEGIGGAFSRRGPWRPVSTVGRMALFSVGVAETTIGLIHLLRTRV